MRILFTGGSSFTGFWFIRELSRAGHEVTATFRKPAEEYGDVLRKKRVSLACEFCQPVFGCSFGDGKFLELAAQGKWDVLCHHAADVTNYKSQEFNVVSALENNTHNLGKVLETLQAGSAGRTCLALTGSAFENDEGAGSEGLPAFSPYGLSKSLTYQVFRYHGVRAGLPVGKFVIPNPFGPYEDPRFTAYLMKTWFAGSVAAVNTPSYVRDNIHVSLLAKIYAGFVEGLPGRSGLTSIRPSGYAENQGAFALRFAAEMRPRLGLDCGVEIKRQIEFQEPRVRINTDFVDPRDLPWNEEESWNEIARYYQDLFGQTRKVAAP